MKKTFLDVTVVGFALFAMFFGAGNLIFPPALGLMSGDTWGIGMLGFLITGIGMPLLGVIAVAKAGGKLNDIGDKISPTFSKILGSVIMLAIGPLLAIPRTGATTAEMGFQPLFPNANPTIMAIIVSTIFFGIVLFFVIKPSSVIDTIGKVLTPVLLISLAVIIIKGITTPLGVPVDTGATASFGKGFTEGYQTMDALASMVFGGMVISSIAAKGYSNKKQQIKLTVMAGAVAALGLALVYGGLGYLGATVSGIYPQDIPRTDLVILITQQLLGNAGKVLIGISVSLACLTTAIGLTANCGEFFSKLSNGRVSYKTVVISVTIFSAIISNLGVDSIVKFSGPILSTVYPVGIVLILMNLLDDYIPNKAAYKGAVIGAFLISIFDTLSSLGINVSVINNAIAKLPLASAGFAWILPAIVGALISVLLSKKKDNTDCNELTEKAADIM